MVGHDEHVPIAHGRRECSHRVVERSVDVGDAARRTLLDPLRPAEMVDVVGGHEDDEEELGLEALHEPDRDLDLLFAGAADELEVDLVALVERELVIEHEWPEPLPELVQELRWIRHALVADRRVEPRDDETVDRGRRARERDVDDAAATSCGGEVVPERGRTALTAVDHSKPVAALVPLGEVPDAVAAGVYAGDHGRPRVRGERVGRGLEDAARAPLEKASEVRELTLRQQRVDDVERRGVETDDGHLRRGHQRVA